MKESHIFVKRGLASLADGAAIDDVCETDNRRFRLIGSAPPGALTQLAVIIWSRVVS